MPGRLFLTASLPEIASAMGARADEGLTAWKRMNIAPGEEILTCDDDRVLSLMRWGILPVGKVNARGRPVMETLVNARGETLFDKSAFAGMRRCIVPASGWYEWTGERRKKVAWSISRPSGELLSFAAVWEAWIAPGGAEIRQVATVTCPPSEDVAPIHHRMGVLLDRAAIPLWLGGDVSTAKSLIRPAPAGTLRVTVADPAPGS